MKQLLSQHCLMKNDGGIIRVPFLVKGKLVTPPKISRREIEEGFSGAGAHTSYLDLPHAQVVREPVIERETMRYTGEYHYQVMPQVTAAELVETDFDRLAADLCSLSAENVLDYLDALTAGLMENRGVVTEALDIYRQTSEFPDAFLDGWLASLPSIIGREAALRMLDSELSFMGRPGSEFMDGWMDTAESITPGWLKNNAAKIFGEGLEPDNRKALVRAMPTRQLHITAGNAPEVPLLSALRAILTRSAAVVKLPSGAILPGALFALAAVTTMPEHPLTRYLSMVYWPGGEPKIEDTLFAPNAFDRVVVWGSPDTVASVRSRVPGTKTIFLNPRYGVSLIGKEAFPDKIEEAAMKASLDAMSYNQKACTSSLVHYIEAGEEHAELYAETLCKSLAKWDEEIPNFVSPVTEGKIKRMRRGRYAGAQWHINRKNGSFSSGVMVSRGEFDILEHPMCRLVIVRPVDSLESALKYLTPSVSTAGVFPEERRLQLRDRILTRGVSNAVPLGESDRYYPGMPHDGMRVLSELVDWKNG